MSDPQALEEEEARLAARLVAEICPVMAAHPPEVQGYALADLLAIWLAGHIVPDNPGATAKLRGELMRMHIGMVRTLIPVNEGMIAARLKTEGGG